MILQRILAWLDERISAVLGLESWTMGSKNSLHTKAFYLNSKKRVGIMGVDGRIHTIMGIRTVFHECDGSKLKRRVHILQSLGKNERFATQEEINVHLESQRREFSTGVGFSVAG